jgi:hypothetical protein
MNSKGNENNKENSNNQKNSITMGIDRVIKYIMLFVIYVLVFLGWNSAKYEFIFLFFYVILNIVTYVFLIMDIVNSPKYYRPVLIIIFSSMIMIMASNIMLFFLLISIYKTYKVDKNIPPKIEYRSKIKINLYKNLSITTNIILGILCLFFFMMYKNDDGTYIPFFDYNKLINLEKTGEIYYFNLFFYILKIILSILLLSLSGYMVYLINDLNGIYRYNQLFYIEDPSSSSSSSSSSTPTTTVSTNPTVFIQKNNSNITRKIINPIKDIFSNININYLTNSMIDLRIYTLEHLNPHKI